MGSLESFVVSEGSPTTWLSCWIRTAFGVLRFRVTAASRYIAPLKFWVWESFGGGQSTGWLCGFLVGFVLRG